MLLYYRLWKQMTLTPPLNLKALGTENKSVQVTQCNYMNSVKQL